MHAIFILMQLPMFSAWPMNCCLQTSCELTWLKAVLECNKTVSTSEESTGSIEKHFSLNAWIDMC